MKAGMIALRIDEARDFLRVAEMACSDLNDRHQRYALLAAICEAIHLLDVIEREVTEC